MWLYHHVWAHISNKDHMYMPAAAGGWPWRDRARGQQTAPVPVWSQAKACLSAPRSGTWRVMWIGSGIRGALHTSFITFPNSTFPQAFIYIYITYTLIDTHNMICTRSQKLSFSLSRTHSHSLDCFFFRFFMCISLNTCLQPYRLNKGFAVRNTPLMTWKSPLANLAVIFGKSSIHFSGKSYLPMVAIASLSCRCMASGRRSIRSTTRVHGQWIASGVNVNVGKDSVSDMLLLIMSRFSCKQWERERDITN